MSEPLTHQHRILATLQQHRGVEVSEVVQLDVVGANALHRAGQRPGECHRVEKLSKVARKHELAVFVGCGAYATRPPRRKSGYACS